MENFLEKLGILGAAILPIWNIPLMARIIRHKSSNDISLAWVFGVWGSLLLMLPSSLTSTSPVLKVFGITNSVLFSLVVVVVMAYRKKPNAKMNEPIESK